MSLSLMVQGCTSDAGKSMLVTALCRIYANRNVKVVPFKPQNMALNSAVTKEGGEIGRAQALQAVAARIEPNIDMNPVLLKPNTDTGAQVIIQGQVMGNLDALDYHDYKPKAAKAVFESFQNLQRDSELVLVEGAGSPAEINLRQGDIANMGFAEQADVPVILIADIDKGGVFAHLVGTLACLSDSERDRIKGFVINKFRGDLRLLQDGLTWLEQKTQKPVIGVIPYLHDLYLDSEDAIHQAKLSEKNATFKVIAPLFPHLSNHTDFDPLIQHPEVNFEFIRHKQPIPNADLIILPGSKNVNFDLEWLKGQGWLDVLLKHLRYGGKLIGICGGLQMMGNKILDPMQTESEQLEYNGLNLFDYDTQLSNQKTLVNKVAQLNLQGKVAEIAGYEIHTGSTDYSNCHFDALISHQGENEGFVSSDNQVFGTYLHGLFDHPDALQLILDWAGYETNVLFDLNHHRETQLEYLAQQTLETLDVTLLDKIIGMNHE